MNKLNDHFYIRQVKAGNTQAFAGIVSNYGQMVYTLISKITQDRDEAEDIAQEVFIKVFQSIDKFREEAEFSTWLYRIAYNTTISEIRKKRIPFASMDDNLNIDQEEDEDDTVKELKLQYLDEALHRIHPDEAFLISLYYMEDQSIQSISKITEISEANVKVKLHRIRKKLAMEMNNLMKEQYG